MLNGVDQYLGYLLELNFVVSCIVSITKHHQIKNNIELHVNYLLRRIGLDCMLL